MTTDTVLRCTDEQLIEQARPLSGKLGRSVVAAIDAFRVHPDPTGCLLLRGLPIGELPPTPARPTDDVDKDQATERLLLAVALRLGEPVGYRPEHSGSLVQNLVPVPTLATRQTSTSSKVNLMFHTEAAFHPFRPRFLLLLCLRGDSQAQTTVASIHAALPHLGDDTIDVLFQPRFRCAIDESYLQGRSNELGPPIPVLSGDRGLPTMVFDEDLMVGIDERAEAALRELGAALIGHHGGVVLEPGDLVILDNDMVVHGRSAFTPRFDGTDRWLQRAFVVEDLAPSAAQRDGRVIVTTFGS